MARTNAPGFSPDTFMSQVGAMGGLARRWKYHVEIVPPSSMPTKDLASDIEFLAESVLLPRKGFSTTEHRIYGINKTMPYETTYEPILMTMLNTNDWKPRKFWDGWLEYIQSPKTYDMQYYKNYTGTVRIYSFNDTTENPTPQDADYSIELEECWPESISAYAMGWANADLANFEISLRFKQWRER